MLKFNGNYSKNGATELSRGIRRTCEYWMLECLHYLLFVSS